MKRTTLLFFCFLIIFSPIVMPAQDENVLRPQVEGRSGRNDNYLYRRSPFTLGVGGGINYNIFSQNMSWSSNVPEPPYRSFEKGAGFSPFFEGLVDFSFNQDLGLQLRLSYDFIHFTNKLTGAYEFRDPLTADTWEPVPTEFDWYLNGSYLGLELLLRYNITREIFVTGGPFMHIPLGDFTGKVTENIISEAQTFPNGSKTNQDNISMTNLTERAGIDVGAGYKIPITGSIYIVPQLRFLFNINDISSASLGSDKSHSGTIGTVSINESGKRLHSIKLLIDFWFEL